MVKRKPAIVLQTSKRGKRNQKPAPVVEKQVRNEKN